MPRDKRGWRVAPAPDGRGLFVDEAHAEVTRLFVEHRGQLDSLTHALLEAETLDAPEAYAAAGVSMRSAELQPERA